MTPQSDVVGGGSHGVPRSAVEDDRARALDRVTLLGAVVNVLLTGVKAFAGIVGGSSVMLADAVHSLSDLISDGVTFFSVKASAKPADDDHPYGHGRYETIGTVVMATVLMAAAVGIAMDAYTRLGTDESPDATALWAALFSLFAKEALFRITAAAGRRHRSPVVTANAWHHRTDALSSLAALLGIAGARAGYPVLDPIAAVVVAAMIAGAAIRFFRDAAHELTERELPKDMMVDLDTGIRALPGVVNVHELRGRRLGPQLLVDLHVQVTGSTTVSDGHQVAERVRSFVYGKCEDVSEVLVHVDPESDGAVHDGHLYRPSELIERDVRQATGTVAGVEAITHVMVHFLERRVDVQVHIAVAPELRVCDAGEIAASLRQRLQTIDDIDSADVHLELDSDAHAEAPIAFATSRTGCARP